MTIGNFECTKKFLIGWLKILNFDLKSPYKRKINLAQKKCICKYSMWLIPLDPVISISAFMLFQCVIFPNTVHPNLIPNRKLFIFINHNINILHAFNKCLYPSGLDIVNSLTDISLIRPQLNFQIFKNNLVLNNIHVSPLMGDTKIYRLAITTTSYSDLTKINHFSTNVKQILETGFNICTTKHHLPSSPPQNTAYGHYAQDVS